MELLISLFICLLVYLVSYKDGHQAVAANGSVRHIFLSRF